MADFCRPCTVDLAGPDAADRSELAGLCEPDQTIAALCEGCDGVVVVDHRGTPIVLNAAPTSRSTA